MVDFSHSEPDLTSQPQYRPLVPMGSPLSQWPGSYIFDIVETSLCDKHHSGEHSNTNLFVGLDTVKYQRI